MPAGLWVVLCAFKAAPGGAELGFKAVILPLSAGGAAYCVRMWKSRADG
jgi:ABC-type methionine transport system permease subunit